VADEFPRLPVPVNNAVTHLEKLQTALADRYRIEREIGVGGMATVYLAHDLRHDRDVALKLLKPELGAVLGPERFLSEIRVTAKLQHPNLLPLFDSGESGGQLWYVMPYVEGESLRARMERERQLSVKEAVRIASLVAGALDYAHRHGVIHRDLKPENILLHEDQPLVADFGIALAVSNAGGERVTQTGLSLGTPQYMSPEQATGERGVDGRTDIYSLGAVTYEMLTGEPPHTGATVQAIIARLMTDTPRSIRATRPTVPEHVDWAVQKALEKVPADRFATAKEFAETLQGQKAITASRAAAFAAPGGTSTYAAVRALRTRLPWIIAGVAAGLLIAALWGWLRPQPPRQVLRYTIALDSTEALTGLYGRIAISPDGSNLIYAGGPQSELFLRPLNELHAVRLPGTADALAPFFSPDGQQVAYLTPTYQLKVVSLKGGPPVTITDSLVGLVGGSWGYDGFIYVTNANLLGTTIVRLPPTPGSAAETVTTVDTANGEIAHRLPDALPNGKGVLFTVYYAGKGRSGTAVAVQDLATGKHTILVNGLQGRYSPSGHLLYVTPNGTLMAVRFDPNKLKTIGEPSAVSEGLHNGTAGAVDLAISRTGTLAFALGAATASNAELLWVARDGETQPVDSTWHAEFNSPSISRDGSRVALAIGTFPFGDIWIKQLDHGPSLKLTYEGTLNDYPTWTPDDHSVTYSTGTNGFYLSLWTKRADGSTQAVLQLRQKDKTLFESLWSPDGKWLVFRTGGRTFGSRDIFAIRPGVDSSPIPLAATKFIELSPDLAPDGRFLVYSSNETGRDEIYVVPFPNAGSAKWPISTGGGSEPRWSHHGDEIFYRDDSGNMVSVPVKTAPTFSFGAPRTLFFARPFFAYSLHRQYDISPDDRRFLMIRRVGSPVPDKLVIVNNWFEELKNKSNK
jgi:eukaryotic-like serine/threonine-protein kinase